jgi:hypothetical protein
MKCGKSFLVAVVALLIVGGFLWRRWNEAAHAPLMGIPQAQGGDDHELIIRRYLRTNNPAPHQSSNEAPHNLGSNY